MHRTRAPSSSYLQPSASGTPSPWTVSCRTNIFEQLASGGTLLWEGSQFSTSEVFLPVNVEGTFSASVSKPVSRLNTIFNTFVPRLDAADNAAGRQVCNTFRGYGESAYSRENLSLQVQLGSTEYPQRPVRGYSEAYMRLLRALGILSSQAHSVAVSRNDFDKTASASRQTARRSAQSNPQDRMFKAWRPASVGASWLTVKDRRILVWIESSSTCIIRSSLRFALAV